MKTRFRASVAFTVLALFLFLNSCKEDFQQLNTTTTVIGSGRTSEIHPLESLAPSLYEPINERYEDYGKLVYHHFKFLPVDDPIEYVPKERRAAYSAALEKDRQDFAGLSIRGKIDKLKNDKLINDNIYKLYVDYFDELNQAFESPTSAIELYQFLRNGEKKLMARSNQEGIGRLLVFSSMLRNHIKYKWEVEEFVKRQAPTSADQAGGKSMGARAAKAPSDFCLFGITGSCWLNVVAQTVFDVATAGLSSGITNALSDKAFFTGVAAAGYAGLAVGFIKNTVAAYKNSNCGCGSPAPPACATPDGLRLLVDGCSLTHYFQVIGGGTDAGNFHYSVQNGSLPEYNNASSITFTNTRLIKVTQNDPNTPVLLTATVACPNGNVPYYSQSYDLYGITRNPEPISLDGAVNVNFDDPSDWIYTAGNGGSNTSNTNNKLIWSRNYAGRTVSGGNDNDNFIKIHWTYRTNTAKVYLQSQNQCSGVSAYRDLSVNVY